MKTLTHKMPLALLVAAGRVMLKGEAPDSAAVERATAIARGTDGVVSVDNQLTVKPKG